MIKVSIIIPIYNAEKYLSRALDCVISQTLKEIEIICINDASTDKSLDILNEYAQKDKRIRIINLPENKGAGNAKNEGLKTAQGQYLGFFDPDDIIDLNYYEELYKVSPNADIVKCKLITQEVDGSRNVSDLNDLIVNKSKFCFSYEYTSAIYKTSLIFDNQITFPPELIVGEDVVFLHKAVIKAKNIKVINNVNYYYIRRQNSLNTYLYDSRRIEDNLKAVEYMTDNYNKALGKDIAEDVYLREYWGIIFFLITYVTKRTNEKELKIKCIKKFIELYNKCLKLPELNVLYPKYNRVLNLIKENKIDKFVEICLKYKNIEDYGIIENLRKNFVKDKTC